MHFKYDDFNVDPMRGHSISEYLVAIDATLWVIHEEKTILYDVAFPIAELANSLNSWLQDKERHDFEFTSMSYEEIGTLRIQATGGQWVVSSIFTPQVQTPPLDLREVERACRTFISAVSTDLEEHGIDPVKVLTQ